LTVGSDTTEEEFDILRKFLESLLFLLGELFRLDFLFNLFAFCGRDGLLSYWLFCGLVEVEN
jgi:hypothetical protein